MSMSTKMAHDNIDDTLDQEEARKLQDGIDVINSLITRATRSSHALISPAASGSMYEDKNEFFDRLVSLM